jgi:hypothetical protein
MVGEAEPASSGETVSSGHGSPRDEPTPARSPAAETEAEALDEAAGHEAETAEDSSEDPGPRGIPVPTPSVEAPPLPGTPAPAPSLRPPPPPVGEDGGEDGGVDGGEDDGEDARTDERPLPADPFPPPFRWATSGNGDASASPDTTQVLRDSGPPADRTQVVHRAAPEPEETQVVRRPPPPRGGPPRSTPLPERTQFVPGAVTARSAGGGVARPEETAAPWAAGAAARSEGPQGRELFARGPGPKAGAILGTAAVVLLVLVVLVASIALA